MSRIRSDMPRRRVRVTRPRKDYGVWKEVFLPPICDNDWSTAAKATGLGEEEFRACVQQVANGPIRRSPKDQTTKAELVLARGLAAVNPEWSPDKAIAAVREAVGAAGIVYPWRLTLYRQYKQTVVVFDVLGEVA